MKKHISIFVRSNIVIVRNRNQCRVLVSLYGIGRYSYSKLNEI